MLPLHFIKSPLITNIRLDILGLLAILGESPVAQTAQIAFQLYAGFLPRLLPAPQALLRTTRPDRLPTIPADVIGYRSGNFRRTLGLVPRLLHPVDHIPKYHVQCLRIERANPDNAPVVTAATWGPVTWLAMAGFGLWVAGIGLSVTYGDGMAILALACLGLVSVFGHAGHFSEIQLADYKKVRKVLPKADVVIRYPNGVFQIISCDEEIARKLYVEPTICVYKLHNPDLYRFLAMVATLLLMIGVVCLGNATSQLQFACACAFLALNVAFWIVAALPEEQHWDLASFKVDPTDKWATPRFSQALWTVIASTGSTKWVRAANIAPNNDAWDAWLDEAQSHLDPCKKPIFKAGTMIEPSWNAQSALERHLEQFEILDDQPSLHPPDTREDDDKQDVLDQTTDDCDAAESEAEEVEKPAQCHLKPECDDEL